MGKTADITAELYRRGMDDLASYEVYDDEEELQDDGTFVECGCCFGMFPLSRMTSCLETHPFCHSCIRRYAGVELGSRNCVLKCIHGSNCAATFHESELRRLLPRALFMLYGRLKQQRHLKETIPERLEMCPFCDWGCAFDVPKEENTLFQCGNSEDCGVESCRLCRKKSHAPQTCEEAEADKHLSGRVAIEEAMTRAVMRVCPKVECDQVFIKMEGCNKITCPMCQTVSCYTCRKAIANYDHFHRNNRGDPGVYAPDGKCHLWDYTPEERHEQEVAEAYEKALEEYKRDHPDVDVDAHLRIRAKGSVKQPGA